MPKNNFVMAQSGVMSFAHGAKFTIIIQTRPVIYLVNIYG